MGVLEMQFSFEHTWQAQDGLAVARAFIAGGDAAVGEPRLDGRELSFARCDVAHAVELDDEGLLKQLCFHWATRLAEMPFTGEGRLRGADGSLCAERVFYDGYVLGFKSLRVAGPDAGEEAWREARWHLWIPLHGHFVDLEAWRTSSDL